MCVGKRLLPACRIYSSARHHSHQPLIALTAGDLLSMTLDIGYALSSAPLLSLFVSPLLGQPSVSSYKPALHWTVILTTSTAGTTLSCFTDRILDLGYAMHGHFVHAIAELSGHLVLQQKDLVGEPYLQMIPVLGRQYSALYYHVWFLSQRERETSNLSHDQNRSLALRRTLGNQNSLFQ